MYQASSTSGVLKTIAVKSGSVSAIYIVNIGGSEVTFSFSNIGGWNRSQALIKNIIFFILLIIELRTLIGA